MTIKKGQTTLAEHNEFASVWVEIIGAGGLVRDVANRFGWSERYTYLRRDMAQKALGISLSAAPKDTHSMMPRLDHAVIRGEEFRVLVVSDWHIWPGYHSRAEEALWAVLAREAFDVVVLNGDVTDQPQISRHGPGRGIQPPKLIDELAEAQTRVADLVKLVRKRNRQVQLLWVFGNHDIRLWRYLATNAADAADLVTFEAYFPDWEFAQSIDINEVCVIKHRWHGGIHAAYNNALRSGATLVTGDTHRLSCTRWSDYTGVRYGVETGMLADPRGPQFQYVDNNPVNWCPGWAELVVSDEVHVELVDCSRRKIRRHGKVIHG